MSKQTTLFQTWGYEGNCVLPSQQQSQPQPQPQPQKQPQKQPQQQSQAKPSTSKQKPKLAKNETRSPMMANSDDVFGMDDEDDILLSRALEMSLQKVEEDQNHHRTPSTPSCTSSFLSTTSKRNDSKNFAPPEGFDEEAGKTWIYPINYQERTYQYNIVKACLFKNTLVALPTGLGKTFIAAVVMYNFFRWYPSAKLVFMAPTKPLVAQQIEACFNIMGIPQIETMEMTGNVSVKTREKAWKQKRILFMTPQVMSNDLSRGLFPAEDVKLLVVDEAHRAQGDYAYCQVVKELQRCNGHFRVVALSATPGKDLNAVKLMLQNLMISHIELRSEESPDILPYTFQRVIEKVVVPLGDELLKIKTQFVLVLETVISRLNRNGALLKQRNSNNALSYTKFGLLQSRNEFRQNRPANIDKRTEGLVESDFAAGITLYHAYELLMQHGMRTFHNFMKSSLSDEAKSRRLRAILKENENWNEIFAKMDEKFSADHENSRLNTSGPRVLSNFSQDTQQDDPENIVVGHPKLERLREMVLEHFRNKKDEKTPTRVMIFSQYRDSVQEITACLHAHKPLIKVMEFVGQAGTKGKKGLSQKAQIEVVKRFREGGFNTLVATCVGEEGLDIGEVDLIVCYDVSKSPIRLVQRMGRTGRKRAGRIIVLVTEGKEEQTYNQSMYNKKSINKAILEKERLRDFLIETPPLVPTWPSEPECLKLKMAQRQFINNKFDKESLAPDNTRRISGMLKKQDQKNKKKSISKSKENAQIETICLDNDPEPVVPTISDMFQNQVRKKDENVPQQSADVIPKKVVDLSDDELSETEFEVLYDLERQLSSHSNSKENKVETCEENDFPDAIEEKLPDWLFDDLKRRSSEKNFRIRPIPEFLRDCKLPDRITQEDMEQFDFHGTVQRIIEVKKFQDVDFEDDAFEFDNTNVDNMIIDKSNVDKSNVDKSNVDKSNVDKSNVRYEPEHSEYPSPSITWQVKDKEEIKSSPSLSPVPRSQNPKFLHLSGIKPDNFPDFSSPGVIEESGLTGSQKQQQMTSTPKFSNKKWTRLSDRKNMLHSPVKGKESLGTDQTKVPVQVVRESSLEAIFANDSGFSNLGKSQKPEGNSLYSATQLTSMLNKENEMNNSFLLSQRHDHQQPQLENVVGGEEEELLFRSEDDEMFLNITEPEMESEHKAEMEKTPFKLPNLQAFECASTKVISHKDDQKHCESPIPVPSNRKRKSNISLDFSSSEKDGKSNFEEETEFVKYDKKEDDEMFQPAQKKAKRSDFLDETNESQSNNEFNTKDQSSKDDSSLLLVQRNKRKNVTRKKRMKSDFIDYEAELSGSDPGGSDDEDENDENLDAFEASFVDDASQKLSLDQRAKYFQSVKSPQHLRRLQNRPLRPITADIFSQAVNASENDDYASDSFCVDSSEVEFQSQMDTLDLLESDLQGNKKKKEEEKAVPNNLKRKKAIARAFVSSSDEDNSILNSPIKEVKVQQNSSNEQSEKELRLAKAKERQEQFKKRRMMMQEKTNPNETRLQDNNSKNPNVTRLRESTNSSMSTTSCVPLVQPTTENPNKNGIVFVSSTEVHKVAELISSLKHDHKIGINVRYLHSAGYLVSSRMAIERVMMGEFFNAANRSKMTEKVQQMNDLYEKPCLILESDKPTEDGVIPRSIHNQGQNRTKYVDTILSQLSDSKFTVLFTETQIESADAISALAVKESQKGFGLPMDLKISKSDEKRIEFFGNIPGVGIGLAMLMLSKFSSVKGLMSSSVATIMSRLNVDEPKARKIYDFFRKSFL